MTEYYKTLLFFKTMAPVAIALIATIVMIIVAIVYEIYRYPIWIREGGIVETLSVFGYVFCLLLMMFKGGWPYIKKYHYFLLLIIIFALRELDFDKKFTTMGVLQSRFYLSAEVPIVEKLIGCMVLCVLAYIVFAIFRNHVKQLIEKLIALDPLYIGSVITLCFIIFSKSIDGIGRKLEVFNIFFAYQSVALFEAIEEVAELGIPLLIISVFSTYYRHQKSIKNSVSR